MNPTEILHDREVTLSSGEVRLAGHLAIPANAAGLVIFAHGSGSSRFSSRNRFVAERLNQARLATLLFDLLTREEQAMDERTRELRFDIGLLGGRLVGVVDWAEGDDVTQGLPVGLFGASTGAAAALICAARRAEVVRAVVSRGGRPDLAADSLQAVRAPTLLIVGGLDRPVLDVNREAAAALTVENRLEIVPGATHLFEEPGKLQQVAHLAARWFALHIMEKNDEHRQSHQGGR